MTTASLPAPARLFAFVPLLLIACSKSGDGPPTGLVTDFSPAANTTISGNVTYRSVTIPAGVTVTASTDLTLTVQGDVKLSGTLKGDCVAMTIKADGAFTNTGGTLNNACTAEPDAGGPGILVIGKTGINVDGGELVTSGDLKMTNDPAQTLTSAVSTVSVQTAGENQVLAQTTGGVPCRYRNYTTRSIPPSRAKGKNGSPKGDDGRDGHYKDLGPCIGGIIIEGLNMSGQKGGDGGDGTVMGSTMAEGGKGGNMGAVLITAPGGDIVFSGVNTITTPDGGTGGNGTATGLGGGGTASAKGGAGGDEAPTGFGGSPILIEATTGSIIVNGVLNIIVGKAGDGGTATATGGKGNDGSPGQPGGSATATGGAGGKTLDKRFTLRGSVGGSGMITVTGGNAGRGGDATANGGVGGNGSAGQPGGKGGSMTARGGNGGNAQLTNQTGALIGYGGGAGNARYTLGNGGAGGSNCPPGAAAGAGGAGGGGGDAIGGAGTVGTGRAPGTAGDAQANNTGNGGKGGDGSPVGAGGPAGANNPPANPAPGSFKPGDPGGPCPGSVSFTVTPPAQPISQGSTGTVRVAITRVGPFNGPVTVTIKDDQNLVLATQTIAASATQADISIPISATFATGSHTFSVTAAGEGIVPVTQTFAVTINASTSVNVTIKNGEQATRPWTKVLFKVGSDATQVIPISPDGSAIISIPKTSTALNLIVQQQVGNNRITTLYQIQSDEFFDGTGAIIPTIAEDLSNWGRAPTTTNIRGVLTNSYGISFAGSASTFWPQPNASPFSVQLNGVETGIEVAAGCVLFNSMQEPVSAVISKRISDGGGSTYDCDLGGPDVKSFTSWQTMVIGVSAGTLLHVTGGYERNGIQSVIASKDFTAPSTTYRSLNGADLPSGVLQWQTVGHFGTNASEGVDYYSRNPYAWTAPLGPPLNTPTVTNTIVGSGAYRFDLRLSIQAEYGRTWFASASQANAFGGQNRVLSFTTRGYFGPSVPETVTLTTPADLQLDFGYLLKPGFGTVTGSIGGFSSSLLVRPSVGFTRSYALRTALTF